MRKVALAIAAVLVLSVVAPAFSQPFADVPTDHWAFDAIAELAAKGIVEGYPDGTFKGDRAMTRYEMAMVVARLLARVEAIKIPPPAPPVKIPPPAVTAADIATLRRLVNEFRAELAALGVRVTAVEEELAALRARLDNTRVTGNTFFRYTMTSTGVPSVSLRNRVQFTGRVGSHVTAVARARFGTFSFATPAAYASVTFDLAYFDWAAPFGMGWRVGRQLFTLGENGLLLDSGSTATAYVDGARVNWAAGPLALTGAVFRETTALDLWAITAGFNVLPGWSTKVHLYSQRPSTGGASSNGIGFDISGTLIPGVSLALDWASFTPAGFSATSALRADVTLNLGAIAGVPTAPRLKLFWKDYGAAGAVAPLYSAAGTEVFGSNTWNMRSWGLQVDVTLNPSWSARAIYETGTVKSTGASFAEWFARARYNVGHGATIDLAYLRADSGGVPGAPSYRIELNYSW